MLRKGRELDVLAVAVATVVCLAMVGEKQPASAAAPAHPFPNHVTYAVGVMPSVSQSSRDAAVEHQYNSWKTSYLAPKCGGYIVVAAEDAPNNGTVSEGQGYGMNIVPLMAGYDPNAQAEFNGEWAFVQSHLDAQGMMQWQIDGSTCRYAAGGVPDAATDGDLDIGYGLILADKQWGGYTAAAQNWLAKLWNADVAADGHLKVEDDDSSSADSRPSDWMLDHLRAFAAYDTSHNWAKVISKTQSLISQFSAAYSPTPALISDFVLGANTASPYPAPARYQENQPDNIVGYNSLRNPWHLGTDALLFGSSSAATSYSAAVKESNCLKSASGGDPGQVHPHVYLNCTWRNTDGYGNLDTQAEEAGDAVGPAAMASGNQSWTDAIWKQLATNPFSDAYYGETIKMLVYIVMAGDYWSPASAASPPPPSPPPSGPVVTNGGFESGNLMGWTTGGTGAAEAVVSPGHTGNFAVRLGSSAPSNGDSSIQQTITVPSSGGMLSFWYQSHCNDDPTWDWEQMEVRSTSGAVLASPLPKNCYNAYSPGPWTQVTFNLNAYAGKTVVLWFNNHDDGYTGDATWTLFDDISVG